MHLRGNALRNVAGTLSGWRSAPVFCELVAFLAGLPLLLRVDWRTGFGVTVVSVVGFGFDLLGDRLAVSRTALAMLRSVPAGRETLMSV